MRGLSTKLQGPRVYWNFQNYFSKEKSIEWAHEVVDQVHEAASQIH
jgi:hypothetical protein